MPTLTRRGVSVLRPLRNQLSATLIALLRLLALLLLVAGFIYLRGCLARPPREATTVQLSAEVTYQRILKETPRRIIIHVADVTLSDQTALYMNFPERPNSSLSYLAKKTTTFLDETGGLLAINAGYFEPFRPGVPFYFYPRTSDPIAPIGLVIGRGDLLWESNGWAAVCVEERRALIVEGDCSAETIAAVAGRDLLIRDGDPTDLIPSQYNDRPYPRTALATNDDGTRVWLIVVDGLQRSYSEGASLIDLQQIGIELGVTNLINLDGGGSSTMAWRNERGVELVNAPFHTWMPMRERPIANFIGVWVKVAE